MKRSSRLSIACAPSFEKMMRIRSNKYGLLVCSVVLVLAVSINGNSITCKSRKSPCFLKHLYCPPECPSTTPSTSASKVCYLDCNSPLCQPQCRNRKPNCNSPGAACLDPRFIGGDGIVFYFHGKRNQHFTLVSDYNLQINAHFIGLRPAGRPRDYTWIPALGILFNAHSFSVEATKATKWDPQIDHLAFSHNGFQLPIPQDYTSSWESSDRSIKVERTSAANSALITLSETAEISVNVVPVTKEDDRVHNYQIPSDDCFAHLEVQFRFFGLSDRVEGVLGRTYRPDFENPAKPGVAMPVVGGEDKYRTASLLSPECKLCIFSSPAAGVLNEYPGVKNYGGALDCSGGLNSGNGIVCRK